MKRLIVSWSMVCVLLVTSACSNRGSGTGDKAPTNKPAENSGTPQKGAAPDPTASDTETPNLLKTIALAYNEYLNKNMKPPQKLDDLAPILEAGKNLPPYTKPALQALKSGALVFNYGIGPKEFNEFGSANLVLIYEKDVPTKGGYVCFADWTVKKLTADEYKAAPTPKKP